MLNKITKFLAYNKKATVMCIDSTDLVEEIRKIHDLTPTTTAVLGRVATVSTLMCFMDLKDLTDNITIQIKGNGPIGTIIAICDLENLKKASIKICADNPYVELPLRKDGKIDVSGAVGKNGFINIIRENELTNGKYNGVSPIVSGEIAEDFTEYFAKSKQQPTVLALGVLVDKDGVKRAGGYIINLMPDATEQEISKIEKAIGKAKPVSELLNEGLNLEQIAKTVTGDENIEIIEENLEVSYKCTCNKDRIERGIISLGKEEIQKIIDEDGKLEAECHFCHRKYVFSKNELEVLKKKSK